MSKIQKIKRSGRLSKKQLQFIQKVTAEGNRHSDRRKYHSILLAVILLWFYLQSFCKRNALVLTILLCSCLFAASFLPIHTAQTGTEAPKSDQQLLQQQQAGLKELRDKVYDTTASEEQNTAFIKALMKENPDVVGWLTIPGTAIDYPVMQTPEDENYYLYRDYYGNENQNGCLLVSAGCDIENENTNWIIHGHNMKSGEMFGSLLNYRTKSYMKKHSLIFLDTMDERRTYQIVAVFESQVYHENDNVFKYYQCYEIESWGEFDSFYNNIKELSLYDTGVDAVYGDHFLTLSTCAYHTENGRFVVVAKELY